MMNEKQFEHIENKIKEAVQNTQIDFDKSSWVKMEALLDKEKKRRPFFWMWFLLPLCMLLGFGINKWTNNKKAIQNIETTAKNTKANETKETNTTGKNLENELQKNATDINAKKIEQNNLINNDNTTGQYKPIAVLYNDNITTSTKTILPNNNNYTNPTSLYSDKKITKEKSRKNVASNVALVTEKDMENDDANNLKNSISTKQKTTTTITASNATSNEQDTVVAIVSGHIAKAINSNDFKNKPDSGSINLKKITAPKDENFLSKFYILGAIGGDIGSVDLFTFNKSSVAAKYGFGLGYEFTKKLSVQTGFYVSNKKYSGGNGDYTPKAGTYLSTVNIQKVDALCKIYEIPVSVRYTFLQKKSLYYYATIGASSYIMKNEDYNYFYLKYNSLQTRFYNYTGNTHLFSNAIFSVGMEKKLNPNFALQVEPYFTIPLKGVGEGSLKLYSTALQLGLKYRPFKK
jgi:Outer membrane protein beta-barrel domain